MTKTKDVLNVKCPGCQSTWTGDPNGTRIRWSWCFACAPSPLTIPRKEG